MTALPAHGVVLGGSTAARPLTRASGTRALRLVPSAPRLLPVDPTTGAPDVAVSGAGPGVDPAVTLDDDAPVPVDMGALPDPRTWAALLAQAVVEVLAGRRPVGQVVRWVDPEIVDRLRASAPARGVTGREVLRWRTPLNLGKCSYLRR